jgi:hypothetical protein
MSKKQAYALAEKLGAKIEDDGWAIQLIAPNNMVSGGNFLHTTAFPTEMGMKEVWERMAYDIKQYGFETCDNKDCGADHWQNNKGGK